MSGFQDGCHRCDWIRSMIKTKYFTIVFEGDITQLPFNPLKCNSNPYGKPVASSAGDALQLLNRIEELADALQRVIDALPSTVIITGNQR